MVNLSKALTLAEAGQQPAPPSILDAVRAAEQPWDRLPGESELWYDRFLRYYLTQDPRKKRTLSEVARQLDMGGAEISRIMDVWQWELRAQAYDHYQQQLQMAEWEARRDQLREFELKISLGILETIVQLLQSVGVNIELPEGSPPVRDTPLLLKLSPTLKANDLKNLLEVASKIGRMATDLPTDHTLSSSLDLNKVRDSRWRSAAPAISDVLEGEIDDDDA